MPYLYTTEAGSAPLRALLAIAATIAAATLRFGYGFGINDQWLLAVQGIHRADPQALRGDWYTETVHLPHWLFDWITYHGSRTGHLPLFYFGYWLASCAILGLAVYWLFERFFGSRQDIWMLVAVPALIALGPVSPLGSTTPILGWALPHTLGGSLAILGLAGVLIGRVRIAMLAAVLAVVVHVQHGAHLGLVLLFHAVLTRASALRRLAIAGLALVVLAAAAVIARQQALTNGEDFVRLCTLYLQFHCYAPSWPLGWFLPAIPMVLGVAAMFWPHRREWRELLPAVLLPIAVVLGTVVLDRFDVPYLAWLVRRFNLYRFVTLVFPFVALGLSSCIATPRSSTVMSWVGFGGIGLWITCYTGALEGTAQGWIFAAVILVGALIWRYARPYVTSRVTAAAWLGLGLLFYLPFWAPGASEPDASAIARSIESIGRALRAEIPPGSRVLAPPHLQWFRFASQRAVIADTKAIPFGGEELREWERRITALGGGSRRGYDLLTTAHVNALVRQYGATHAVISSRAAARPAAEARWQPVGRISPDYVIYKIDGSLP